MYIITSMLIQKLCACLFQYLSISVFEWLPTFLCVCVCVLQTYFQSVNEFLRLEKIVFGDIRGEVLTKLVEGMYTEFNDLLSAFQGKGEDPLDLTTTVSLCILHTRTH